MAQKTWIGTNSGNVGTWSVAANWQDAGGTTSTAIPATGDDVFIENSSQDISSGLAQSGVTLSSLNIAQSYTGKVGTTSAYLAISATTTNIGLQADGGTSQGSGRIKLDFGSNQTTCNVFNTGASPADTNMQCVIVKGTHASNALYVTRGIVGVATATSGEAATMATVDVGSSSAGGGNVVLGAGCTLTTVNVGAGTLTNMGAAGTTLNVNGSNATYSCFGSGAHTTINCDAGQVKYQSSGTITTANITGTLDLTADPRGKTITTLHVYKGATLKLFNGTPLAHTLTNGIALQKCALSDISFSYGAGYTLALS
jgi:hypothetical protein